MEGYVKRSGADSSGRDYEIKIASLFALRCALRRDVQDVWLGSNLDQVGNFDDVVLFKRSVDGSVCAYLMQLKHQDLPKNIKQREFKSNAKGSSKDFNLAKYYEEYAKIQTKIQHPQQDDETLIVTDLRMARKIYYILYTNRAVKGCDFIEEAVDESLRFLNTSAKESFYKFKGLPEYSDSFLNDLYLFTEQTHLNNTEHLMKNEVKSVLGNDISNDELNLFVERYSVFVRMWGNDRSICQPLTKRDVLNQTMDSLLGSYKISLSKDLFTCYSHPNEFIWNELVSKKLVTVVDFSDEVVTFLKAYVGTELKGYDIRPVRTWSDIVKGGVQLLSSRNVRMFDAKNDVTVIEMYKHLWYEKKVPLLLQVDTIDEYKKVHRVLKLGGFATRVIIVTKNDVAGTIKFKRDLYLSCLADLGSDVINTLVQIPVKLQGRGPIQLKDVVDETMHRLIKVCDIIAILSGTYTIGNRFKELPRFFIERFFPKVLIKPKALDELENDFFLIESEGSLTSKNKNVLMVRRRDEALHNLPKAKKEHRRVHWLKYDRHLEWLQSFGGAASLERYLYELPNFTKSVADLCSTINVVSASPGMGKSVLLDYVALNAPTCKWVVRMNLADFEDKPLWEVLEFVHGNAAIDRIIFEKFKLRGDVVILLDGFDEVSINRQEFVLEFAKSLIGEGFALWMTTRAFMKSNLETVFGTIAMTLVPFTVDDQRSFLVKYFGNEPGQQSSVLRDFVDRLLVAAQNNLHDWDYEFTGIPLQTKLLADVFYADCKKSCDSGVTIFNENFDLIYLYDEFVRKKLDIMTQKFGRTAMEMRVLFEYQQKLFALRAVFPKIYLQALDVERQLEEFSRNDDYKIQFMQREGIVVIESGTVIKFVHRTFAEYLAAQWLSENPCKDLIQLRFLNQYTFLFNLFDRIVSRNNALHSSVINLKTSDALDLITRKPELAGEVDTCGRNVAHMIALYGTHHKPYQHLEAVADSLLEVLEEIKGVKELVHTSDKALSYTPLDYAVAAWSLSIANFLSCHNSTINAEIDHYRKDAYFAHCATLKYSSLFRVLLTYFSAREILFIRNTAEDTLVSQFFLSSNIKPTDHDNISLMMAKDVYNRPLLDLFKRRYLDEYIDLPDYYYDLRFAAGYGTPENVEYLLNKGADVDYQDIDKNTCLHYACINGHLENVRLLLNNDANVNLVNANNNSPLHYAIRRDHSEIAKLLLEYGANPNFQNRNKFTVLHFALTCAKKKDLVELMIKSGADSNIQNNKLNTALHYAAQMGYDDVLLSMIRRGGDVNKTNYNDESPLFFAMRSGHVGVASMLLKKGAGVHLRNKYQQTVLNIAAEFGYKDLVFEFLDRGANVNSVDVDKDTALNDALMHKHFDIAKVLLENGADGSIRNKDGYCALHYVAGADSDLLEEILKKVDVNTQTVTDDTALHLALSKNKVSNAIELLRRGADVNIFNRDGNTPLHIAAFLGNSDIVCEILTKSTDCDKPNGFGDTPLHLALKKRHIACANLLLLARCDVNKTNEEGTALHYAVKKCCIEIVQFLIKSGCKIDVRNKCGMTPLHVAVTETLHDSNPIIEDCLLVIEILLKAGADVNSKDDCGNTPFHYISRLDSIFLSEEVQKKTCKQVAQMFIENGANIKILNEEGESALSKRQRHSSCTIS